MIEFKVIHNRRRSNSTDSINSRNSKKGFTLIELLVVVIIIIILFAFTIGAVNYAKIQARKMNCANNLRQIGAALETYASENGGQYPQDFGLWGPWFSSALYPTYIDDDKVFYCPFYDSHVLGAPHYIYNRPVPTSLSTFVIIDDTFHSPGSHITLYKGGRVVVK